MPDTVASILKELEAMGSEQTRKVLKNHGVPEPLFGVKVGDMKPIMKRLKKNHDLSMGLYATGNADAMYLAGLIADEHRLSKEDLEGWLKQATSPLIIEYMIPWVAAETPFGWELGVKWIDAKQEKMQGAGWATLSSVMSITPDAQLDIDALRALIRRVEDEIHNAPNRVRYAMNSFLISAGTFVATLTRDAIAAGRRNGLVEVEMNGTACKVPSVVEYLAKVESMGRIGKKKKQARC